MMKNDEDMQRMRDEASRQDCLICHQDPCVCVAPDMVADVDAFHTKFGLFYDGEPRALPDELLQFRLDFMREEMGEYRVQRYLLAQLLSERPLNIDAIATVLDKQIDALVDLVYVVIGTARLHGFDFNASWRRVHEKNMQKVRAQHADESKRGSTFDVIKPPGWTPPSHVDLVRHHAHQNVHADSQCEACKVCHACRCSPYPSKIPCRVDRLFGLCCCRPVGVISGEIQ
jgi:predicted HAD superfamily Cof-like phosphohydrolase